MAENTTADEIDTDVEDVPQDEIVVLAQKWKKKRGSLIMALHELQGRLGYVPRDQAMKLGREMGVPLANIYEVLTFYNYFKLESPGKYIVSVCTGTACHIKGSPKLLQGLEDELGIKAGESTPDGEYHLQGVRCLGCCGLAPLASVNGKVYGKLDTSDSHAVLEHVKVDQPVASRPDDDAAAAD
jgi:NADH-quinone oxidoreductase subunit E